MVKITEKEGKYALVLQNPAKELWQRKMAYEEHEHAMELAALEGLRQELVAEREKCELELEK